MGWITGVFLLVWPWLLKILSALGLVVIGVGGWRFILAWAQSVDRREAVFVECRNTLNEIRDELKAMRQEGGTVSNEHPLRKGERR